MDEETRFWIADTKIHTRRTAAMQRSKRSNGKEAKDAYQQWRAKFPQRLEKGIL